MALKVTVLGAPSTWVRGAGGTEPLGMRSGGCWQREDVGHTLLVLSGVLGFADQGQPRQPEALQRVVTAPAGLTKCKGR